MFGLKGGDRNTHTTQSLFHDIGTQPLGRSLLRTDTCAQRTEGVAELVQATW
jgi:hypothetical protein